MKSCLEVVLERSYWISQIILMIIALGAAFAAFLQLRTYKLFELLKFLEAPDFRASRRVVLRKIYKRKDEDWWLDQNEGEKLEESASNVCAAYDILARMIEYDNFERIFPHYGRFFRRHWARSIIGNHDALKGFLRYRRVAYPDAYAAFSEMAEAAEKEVGPMKPLQPV